MKFFLLLDVGASEIQDQCQFNLIALVIRSAQVRSSGESTLTFSKINPTK